MRYFGYLTILAFWTNLAFGEVGFYKLSDPRIPQPVARVADSVFRIEFVYGKYAVLEGAKAMQEKLNGLTGDDLKTEIVKAQIEFCMEHDLDVCVFAEDELQVESGTAFVVEDGKTLWTNFHVIHDQVMAFYNYCRKKLGQTHSECVVQLKDRPLFTQLLDKNLEPVFLSSKETYLKINRIPVEEGLYSDRAYTTGKNLFAQLQDAAQLVTNVPLGQPLQYADDHLREVGNTVYAIGFPFATTDRASVGKPDSKNDGQVVTFGEMLSALDAETRGRHADRRSTVGVEEFGRFLNPLKVYFWGDGYSGQSGAPILNANGEIIGIFSESSEIKTFNNESSLPHGVSVKQMLRIE